MNTIKIWIVAARPKTLPISIGPALLGTLLAYGDGFFHLPLFCITLFTSLGLQISANFANDYFDFLKGSDTKNRKGPLRVTQAGLVSLLTMKKALFLCFGFTALLGSYLIWHGGLVIGCLVALSLLFAALYTAGPFPLAYRGLGDVFAFAFFGPIAVAGAHFLQASYFSWNAVFLGIGAGTLSVTPLILNNIRDQSEDLAANKKTLIVRFGKRFGQIEYLACIAVTCCISLLFSLSHPLCLLSLLFVLPALTVIRSIFTFSDPRSLNDTFVQNGQALILYYLLFCLGWFVS